LKAGLTSGAGATVRLPDLASTGQRLASHFQADWLNQNGFQLYEQFRPEVPSDERGWGAKGVLDLAWIRALAPR
jgi:hypothetical protein